MERYNIAVSSRCFFLLSSNLPLSLGTAAALAFAALLVCRRMRVRFGCGCDVDGTEHLRYCAHGRARGWHRVCSRLWRTASGSKLGRLLAMDPRQPRSHYGNARQLSPRRGLRALQGPSFDIFAQNEVDTQGPGQDLRHPDAGTTHRKGQAACRLVRWR